MHSENELFEKRSVLGAIMSLALPSVVGQIILVIYNMADTLFVGMTGSDAMITAVTVCMPAFMFLSAISNLFGVGAASVIARAFGKNDGMRVRNTAAFAVWSCMIVTVLYCGGVWLMMDRFVDLLGGSDAAVHADAVKYMRIVVVYGGLAASMSTLLSHIIRSGGQSVRASIGVALGGVLNIALDPLFMFVILPRGNEAVGAAIATALSNVAALLYYIISLLFDGDRHFISVKPSRAMFREHIPRDVLLVGIPACLMTLCENISYAVLDNLMAVYGTAAQAGIGVAKKINMMAHCIVRGMAQGVLPLIGYNYASGNRTRMKKVIGASVCISVGISLACMGAYLLFAKPLVTLFIRTEADSLRCGAEFLRILCVGAPFSAFAYTVISFFQATGRGGKSLILALMRKGLVDIPLMLILGGVLPIYGIVLATPLADAICCATAAVLFAVFLKRHGKDKAPRLTV